MEAVAEEVRSQVDDRPFLSDPYLDWAEAQNIPIVEDLASIYLTYRLVLGSISNAMAAWHI